MDYNQASMQFEQYLNGYDRTDGKVRLKIIHTYGVVERSVQIAERMGLSEEDQELAPSPPRTLNGPSGNPYSR